MWEREKCVCWRQVEVRSRSDWDIDVKRGGVYEQQGGRSVVR